MNTLQLAINAFKELLHSPDNKAARAKARIELETLSEYLSENQRSDNECKELRARLDEIADIIWAGDGRLLAQDGPVGGQPPLIRLDEWRRIWLLAKTGSSKYDVL